MKKITIKELAKEYNYGLRGARRMRIFLPRDVNGDVEISITITQFEKEILQKLSESKNEHDTLCNYRTIHNGCYRCELESLCSSFNMNNFECNYDVITAQRILKVAEVE